MANHRRSKKFKRRKVDIKLAKRQKSRQEHSVRKVYNADQRSRMRSRAAEIKQCRAEDKLHRRRNLEAVRKHREVNDENTLSQKRKKARKRWERCVEEYENEIREYYSSVCNCCGRLCRKSQTKTLTKTSLAEKGAHQKFITDVFYVKEDGEHFCKTCHLHISKKNMPRLALCNGLDFPVVDKVILKLNRLEERLLSARHVFQTLWTVKGPVGQYKTKGGIVNVPVNIDTTVNKLPRAINDTHMIHVRLARKLEYVKNYMSGIVRPKLLYKAAKNLVGKPLLMEEGIELSTSWSNSNFEDGDISEFDEDDEFYTDNAIHETLLTHDSLAFNSLASQGVRIAPAEGYKPQSLLFDGKCEFLAFPTVFGGYKMEPKFYNKSLPYSDFAKSIATRYDRRVSGRGDLLLFIAKKLELLKLYNNIGICLKKKKVAGRSVTAGEMLNKSYVDGLVQHNDGYKILKGVRSSPAHWMNEKVKLLAQIRQFGLPTLFVTLSAADTRWPELIVALKLSVDKVNISEEEAKGMSSKDRALLVQKDPITCAQHFDQRFRAIMRTWDSTEGPFNESCITHSYHRIEFQQRGSPHAHMLLWLKNAPKYNPDEKQSAQEVCDFVDSIISCSSADLDEELVKLQTHRHSHTCQKKNNSDECRFGIPYFPMRTTRILKPISDNHTSSQRRKYSKVLKQIKMQLKKEETQGMTYDEFLNTLGIDEKMYITAIRSSLNKNQIFLKRVPRDIYISPFSKKILQLMRSNINVQFVLDAFGAATYIIDYINKSSRGMSNLMREVLKQVREGNENLRESLRKISNAFYNNSELSIQEACYNILQLPLSKSSEECVFIPTFPPTDRVRMVKSEQKLQELDNDCTNIFEPGLIEHYANRPHDLPNLCLAEFAANYKYSTVRGRHSLALKNESGYITKTRHCKIIRYRNYHYEVDPDNYLRENIMLYLPWRNEKRDILEQDLEDVFTSNKTQISETKKLFNAFSDEALHLAFDEAMARPDDERQDQDKATKIKFDFDDYSFDDEFTVADIQNELKDDSQMENVKFISPGKMEEDKYQQLFENLNQKQRDFIMHVADNFKTTPTKQLLYFLTGGAGVGKSMTINTLYQTLFRLFNSSPNDNPDDPKILLCGPTGKSSFNIGGQTLHSAFKLPLNTKTLNELSANVSNTLATKLHCLKVVIIDEISMVGQHTLQMVDQRLRHLFNKEELFGGISIITVGDFFQLRPVCATALYYPQATNPYTEIFNKSLWHHFKVYKLDKIMRQNEKNFQVALNNLARGQLTERDNQLFQSRTFKKLPREHDCRKAIHLFARNEDVDNYNQKMLKKITGEETVCTASDVFHGHGSELAKRQMEYSVSKSKTHQTMGLPLQITLKVGAMYMVTYNVDTEDGICNGATGELKKIQYGTNHKGEKKPLRVWIQFEDSKVGSLTRRKFADYIRNHSIPSDWTPVEPISLTIRTRKTSSLKINRKQFPLTLAHALTVHKSQGQSLAKVVVHLEKRNMPRDQLYVACSRAMTINGLFIVGKFSEPKKLEKNSFLYTETKRWKHQKLQPKFDVLRHKSKQIKMMYHNVQSLKKHINLVRNDENFTCNDVLILGETWTIPEDRMKIKGYKLVQQSTSSNVRKAQGVSMYVKKELLQHVVSSKQINCHNKTGRIQAIVVQLRNTLVIGVYAKPKTSSVLWRKFFGLLPLLPHQETILIGDCNINSKHIKGKHFLSRLLQQHKLIIHNKCTHNTHAKTCLTLLISNTKLSCGTYTSFFSHHYPVWLKKKKLL